ncbi:MAG TPA: hypothetical protein VIY09_06110, partial [Rhizomicrobium sp.]
EYPRIIGPCTHLLFASNDIERCGDHAAGRLRKAPSVQGERDPIRTVHSAGCAAGKIFVN